MKNFKILFALFLVFAVIFSCNKEAVTEDSISSSSKLTLNGQLHNEGLGLILDSYKSKTDWEYTEIFSKLKDYTIELRPMINEKGGYEMTVEEVENAVAIMDEILPEIVNNDTDAISSFLAKKSISPQRIDALKSISTVIKKDFSSVDEAFAAIDLQKEELEKYGLLDTDIEESIGVLKASIIYWSENANSWKEIDYNGATNRSKFWDTINGMAEADFWSFATVTMIAGPHAGVAAGCYGSAGSGIKALVTGSCC